MWQSSKRGREKSKGGVDFCVQCGVWGAAIVVIFALRASDEECRAMLSVAASTENGGALFVVSTLEREKRWGA